MDRRVTRALAVAALVVAAIFVGAWLLRPRGLADSRDPRFADAADRVAWIEGRLDGAPPTPILDAHFVEEVHRHAGSHMGPGWSMRTLRARIELAPGSGPAWIDRTTPHVVAADASIYGARPQVPWGVDAGDLDGAAWRFPPPLFDSDGTVAVSADGSKVFVYLVRK